MPSLAAALALAAAVAGQVPSPPPAIPPAAAKAAKEAADKVAKARKQFEAEAKAAQDALVAELTALADAEAKKNNRTTAAVLRSEIDRLRRADATEFAPAALPMDVQAFPGFWQVRAAGGQYKAVWAVGADGTLLRTDAAGKGEGRWIADDRWKLLVVVWAAGGVETFPLPINPARTVGRNGNKEIVEMAKMP